MNSDRPGQKSKDLDELWKIGQEGIAKPSPAPKPAGDYPYGYGLSFISRARLSLRSAALKRFAPVILLVSLAWLVILTVILNTLVLPQIVVILLALPPFLLMVFAAILFRSRRT